MRALPLLFVLSTALVATAPARAQAVALLPAVGGASDADRKAFDTALRKAFADVDGVELQSSADTKRHVLSLAELGLVCLTDDVPCLAKLGLAADVALVLVPVVEPTKPSGADVFDVEIGVIDVPKSGRVRSAKGAVDPAKASDVEALVDQALGRTGSGRDPEPDPEADPEPDPERDPEPNPEPVDTNAEGPSLSTIGFIVAGVGGGVFGIGVAGAAFCELAYAGAVGGFDANTRASVLRPSGIALWITSAVGVVGLASGLVLALVASPAEAE